MALVVLDASVVIAFLDSRDAHHPAAVAALAANRAAELVLPASVYAEILVGPWRQGPEAVARIERFVADLALRIEPLSAAIAGEAVRLRARHSALKLPDAFVLATGDILGAARVLTADRHWTKLSRRAQAI